MTDCAVHPGTDHDSYDNRTRAEKEAAAESCALPLGDAYGYTPTALDRALDAAIAADEPMPEEDLAAVLNTPAVRKAFRVAAARKGLPDPFPQDTGACILCGRGISVPVITDGRPAVWACLTGCSRELSRS